MVFDVRVIPCASKSEIVGIYGDALKIRIASPPVDGAANAELIRLLAKQFGVTKCSVEIIAGATSKTKRVSIAGASADVLKAFY